MLEDSNNSAQLKSSIQPILLERLRDETRDVHVALEEQLPLTSPDLTLTAYRELLERFYAFYRDFEAQVMPLLPQDWLAFLEDRRKVPALISDLEFLGSCKDDLPCPALPPYNSLPKILGALYVIEGSTLGGQLIARHLTRMLGLSQNEGCQFFSGYGSETGSRWNTFKEKLLEASSPQIYDEIVMSARLTFEAMQQCLLVPADRTAAI